MWLFAKNLVFTLLVPGTVAGYIPCYLIRENIHLSILDLALGSISAMIGLSGYVWCLWDFAHHGRGTPAPVDAPRILVVRGLYRILRNPMYVSVLLVILGWAIAFHSLPVALYVVLIAGLFHLFVVVYEEPHLTAFFGASYRAYCARTNRWIPSPRAFLKQEPESP